MCQLGGSCSHWDINLPEDKLAVSPYLSHLLCDLLSAMCSHSPDVLGFIPGPIANGHSLSMTLFSYVYTSVTCTDRAQIKLVQLVTVLPYNSMTVEALDQTDALDLDHLLCSMYGRCWRCQAAVPPRPGARQHSV